MELFFPQNISCIACSLPIHRDNYLSLCRSCYRKLRFVEEICIRCGRSGKGRTLCTGCAQERYYFDCVYSVLEYNDWMHHQIYRYKYGHKSFLGKYFGKLMDDFLVQNQIQYDFVVPVPIADRRKKNRGFNQSLLLAQAINEERTLELFVRKKHTAFLSGLSAANRMIELQNAFSIDEAVLEKLVRRYYETETLQNKRSTPNEIAEETEKTAERKIKILLVDDILTTGSTLNELSKLVKTQLHEVQIIALTLCNARK